MARKINTVNSVPLVVDVQYAPLNAALVIRSSGQQSLDQWYDEATGAWKPNRASVEPLTLTPVLSVGDPDGLVPAYPTAFKSVVWRELVESGGTVTDNGPVTDIQDTVVIGGQSVRVYTQNADGSLVVRRNVPYTSSYRLRCILTYVDTRMGADMKFQRDVLLTTSKTEAAAYVMELTTPRQRIFRPLIARSVSTAPAAGEAFNYLLNGVLATNNATFGVRLNRGGELVTARYFWYWVDSDHPDGVLFGDSNTPCAAYVSGQGTATLTLNPDRTAGLTVMVRAAATASAATPDIPLREYFSLQVVYDELTGIVNSRNGSTLRGNMASMQFGQMLHACGRDLDESVRAEYVRTNWKHKLASAAASVNDGWGTDIVLDRSLLTAPAGDSTLVYAENHVLSPMELLTHDGDLLTHDGEYVIGRG
jgi:hypothetical protein